MLLNRIKAIVVLVNCLFAFAVSAQRAESPVVITINKKPVYADEIMYLYRKPNQNKPDEFTKEKVEEYVELFTKFKLKVEEAKNRGYDTTAAFQREYNGYREELRKPYLPDSKIVDSLTKLTYDRLKEEVRASHLLINCAPDASPEDTLRAFTTIVQLRNRVVQGENFASLVAEASQEPNAKVTKGDLGYFTAMQMVFPFEQVAYATPVGEVSQPVRTQFGYHLIHVVDRKPARGEVEIAHIMIRSQGPDDTKARNTIFEVYDQLQKGVSWEELVKEYSDDTSTKESGGKIRPFGVGAMARWPDFENAAFNLKNAGDFSDPVQTEFGWHILRLINKISLPSYDQIASSLRTRVSRDERVQISKQAVTNKMKREFAFQESVDGKTQLLNQPDSTLQKKKWMTDAILAGKSLFTVGGKSFLVGDFAKFIQRTRKTASLDKKSLIQFYNEFANEILGLQMEEKIKQQNPDYAWLLKEYYEGILLFEIMEREVWNKATEDSVGQVKYFEANRAKYKAGERVEARIYSTSSTTVMDQLKKFLEAGDSAKLGDWIKREKVRQESGNFEKTERPVLEKVSWAPGYYRVEHNGSHYLVWIKKVLPPGNRTFAEARASVISDYQNHLENEWLSKLRKKYSVKVSKKGKQYLFDQLVKK